MSKENKKHIAGRILTACLFALVFTTSFAQSKSSLKKLADGGDASAMYSLGLRYIFDGKFDEAAELLSKAYDLGKVEAGTALFKIYSAKAYSPKKKCYSNINSEKADVLAMKMTVYEDIDAMYQYALRSYGRNNHIETPLSLHIYGKIITSPNYVRKDFDMIYDHVKLIIKNDSTSSDCQYLEILLPYLIKSCEDGKTWFCDIVGKCYYEGRAVEKNYREAVYWWQKGYDNGNYDGAHWLGLCYYNGEGVSQDKDKGIRILETAYNNGNRKAGITLGDLYYAEGDRQDIGKAVNYWEGLYNSLHSVIYDQNGRHRSNYEYKYYKLTGNDWSLYYIPADRLARCYEKGIGKEKNLEKAINLYQETFREGNQYAGYKLLELANVDIRSLLTSPQMNDNFKGQNLLGLIYLLEKDDAKAMECWEHAQTINPKEVSHFLAVFKAGSTPTSEDYYAVGEALYELAAKNIEGVGEKLKELSEVKKSLDCSYWLARYAVDYKHPEVLNGEDPSQKLYSFAENGYAPALYYTGKACLEGQLGAEKTGEAAAWFLKAAKKGNAEAQQALGECYARGTGGVAADYHSAISWLSEAETKIEAAKKYKEYLTSCNNMHGLYENVKQRIASNNADMAGYQEISDFIQNHTNKSDYQLLEANPLFTHLPQELKLMDGYYKICDLLSFNPESRIYWSRNNFFITFYYFDAKRVERDDEYLVNGIEECKTITIDGLKDFSLFAQQQLEKKRGQIQEKAQRDKAYVDEQEERSNQASTSASSYSSIDDNHENVAGVNPEGDVEYTSETGWQEVGFLNRPTIFHKLMKTIRFKDGTRVEIYKVPDSDNFLGGYHEYGTEADAAAAGYFAKKHHLERKKGKIASMSIF